MKVYDYECLVCGRVYEVFGRGDDWLPCSTTGCDALMAKLPAAPHGRVRGRADGNDRSDADRFTADVLGVKENELPHGLRSRR